MVQITMQVPEDLANKIQPMQIGCQRFSNSVCSASNVGNETQQSYSAFAANPSPQQVLDYHVSERAQERLQRLLALNAAGLLGQDEQRELDELNKIEHTIIKLKAQLAKQVLRGA
jgi:hypothetical protein